jgi:hypothetical protein
LLSQAGTTEVSSSALAEPTVGRTPQAIAAIRTRESARDNWEAFMMDQTIQAIMDRWTALINQKLPGKVMVRLFDDEIATIAKKYPDVKELVEKQGKTIAVAATEVKAADGYDYRHEQNSTVQPATDVMAKELASVIELVTAKPEIIAKMQAEGKDILVSELMERIIRLTSIKDAERIIVDHGSTQQAQTTEAPDAAVGEPPVVPPPGVPAGVPAGAPATPPTNFTDPEIAAMANRAMGGAGAIRNIPTEGEAP